MTEIDSHARGNPTVEATKAHFADTVTPDNERYVRTFHKSLAGATWVAVLTEESGKAIWMVHAEHGLLVPDTHAGGREIHIVPGFEQPAPMRYPFQEDRIPRRINPRKMLTAADLALIRYMFPTCTGVRLLIVGHIIILFKNRIDLESAWKAGVPDEIGGLCVGYEISEYRATATPVHSGYAVAHSADSFESMGCLGLRLELRSGQEAITTTTHAFVELVREMHPVVRRLNDWYLRAKRSLARYRSPQPESHVPAVAGLRQPTANTSIGKTVWLAGTNRKVGKITRTYDPLGDGALWFPIGFTHDLSLIMDENLPEITSPPGVAPIAGWAEYSEALGGCPVFVSRLNASCNAWRTLPGTVAEASTQIAVIAGSEYIWDRDIRCQNASLLWRCEYAPDRATGYSGSVLCLGKPKDESCKAILFQPSCKIMRIVLGLCIFFYTFLYILL